MKQHRLSKRAKLLPHRKSKLPARDSRFSKLKVAVVKWMPPTHRLGRWLIALLMVALCMGMSFYKINSVKKLPFFDPDDGEGFYWTENAFHFRHAEMIADGRAIPPLDRGIQYPEGLDTARYITPVMERVAGGLYHFFFRGMHLHVFLIYFSSIFSTLSVLAVFFAGKFLWRSNWAGFISACFYSFTPAGFGRTIGGGFIREDFALPFIFFSFACFMYCLRRDSPLVAVIGSLFLAVALAAWHVTQFYVFLFIAGFVIIFFLQKRESLPRISFTIFTIITAVAAAGLPVLRVKQFAFSPQMMASYGLLAALWLLPRCGVRGRAKEIFWAGLVILAFFIAGLMVQKYSGSHSHVYSLILSKIKYLGKLPQDATKLSFETKVMWTSAFVSPTLKEIFMFLSSTLVLGAVALLRSIIRILKRRAQQGEIMMVYFALFTFLLFLMIHRLSVFTVFFFALPIGSLVLVKARIMKVFSYLCIGICLIFLIYPLSRLKVVPFRPPQGYVKDVIHFVKANTTRDEAVLTSFQLGPSIAAYGERPTILHSKFESKLIRDKVKDVYTSLYRSEEDFYQVCRRYDAKLFVYQSDMVLGSNPGTIRYNAGAVHLKKDSAAALFHFAPERLKHFRLVHQNYIYRLFRVGEKVPEMAGDLRYEPLYDLSVYCAAESLGEDISDSIIASGLNKLQKPQTHKMLGDRFFSRGDFRTAALEYWRALTINPKHQAAAQGLAEALYQSQDVNDLPDAVIWIAVGRNQLAAAKYGRAEKLFRAALQLEPHSAEAYLRLGIALLMQDRFKEARDALHRAASYDPKSYEAYENLGKVYVSLGAYDKAVKVVQMSLSLNPNQPHLIEILKELEDLARGQSGEK